LNEPKRQWIKGVFKLQNYLVAEPLLDKLIDLSFQFEVLKDASIRYHGYSVFITNSNGQYQASLINPDLNALIPSFSESEYFPMIEETVKALTKALEKSVFAKEYEGILGIDAIIFNDSGKPKIQPCIEVNCRMNMGILSLKLGERYFPGKSCRFELFKGNPGEFLNFTIKHPEYLPLVEPLNTNRFGAYLAIEEPK